MIKDAIDRILALAAVQRIQVGSREYADRSLTPIKPPRQSELTVSTLSAIEDYFRDNPDTAALDKAIVHIRSAIRVDVMSPVTDEWLQRDDYLTAKIEHKRFPFGKYLSIEEFMIAVQSYFVQDATTEALLKVVGNLSDDTSVKYEDDGVTQVVQAKVGIAKIGNISLPNPVMLAPYRTFLDVEQPASAFVFRLKKHENGPLAMLEEADGGNWNVECIKRVRDHLRVILPAGTVILA